MKEIKLTQGKTALVDDEWYEYLNQWQWHYRREKKTGYAQRNVGKYPFVKHIQMHRIIMNTPHGMQVDHIDFNGCNNQTYNLRNVTHKENHRHLQISRNNTSGFRGVVKNGNNWSARIMVDYKTINLGTFKTKEDAARVYDSAARKYFGQYAVLNFQDRQESAYQLTKD